MEYDVRCFNTLFQDYPFAVLFYLLLFQSRKHIQNTLLSVAPSPNIRSEGKLAVAYSIAFA